jgi:hypothetical protein
MSNYSMVGQVAKAAIDVELKRSKKERNGAKYYIDIGLQVAEYTFYKPAKQGKDYFKHIKQGQDKVLVSTSPKKDGAKYGFEDNFFNLSVNNIHQYMGAMLDTR